MTWLSERNWLKGRKGMYAALREVQHLLIERAHKTWVDRCKRFETQWREECKVRKEREQKEAEDKRVRDEATKEGKRQADALQQANAEKKRSSERRGARQQKNEDGSSGAAGQVRSQRTTNRANAVLPSSQITNGNHAQQSGNSANGSGSFSRKRLYFDRDAPR
jgi:hypothetical protein